MVRRRRGQRWGENEMRGKRKDESKAKEEKVAEDEGRTQRGERIRING